MALNVLFGVSVLWSTFHADQGKLLYVNTYFARALSRGHKTCGDCAIAASWI